MALPGASLSPTLGIYEISPKLLTLPRGYDKGYLTTNGGALLLTPTVARSHEPDPSPEPTSSVLRNSTLKGQARIQCTEPQACQKVQFWQRPGPPPVAEQRPSL